jgi:uncharacterized membrane protein
MWIVGILSIIIPVGILIVLHDKTEIILQVSIKTLMFGIILTVIDTFFFLKFYNSLLAFMSIIVLGLVFNFFHLPGSYVILFGAILSSITLLNVFVKFSIENDLPKYINRFGAVASLIIAINLIAFAFRVVNYRLADYLDYTSVSLLILIILALVFTLPSSGFVDWTKQSKKVFYRGLMIPIAFLFIIMASIKLYPNVLKMDISTLSDNNNHFSMSKVVLKKKDGLKTD